MPTRADYFPPLEVGTLVCPSTAMVDRVGLSLTGWHIVGKVADVAEVLSLTAQAITPAADGHARLFRNRTFDAARKTHTLEVIGSGQGEAPTYPYPTFAGKLYANVLPRTRFIQLNAGQIDLVGQLQLNVSRSLMAQRLAFTKLGQPLRRRGPFLLAIAPQRDWSTSERLLVNADNVIIGSERRLGFAFAAPPEEHLSEYIDAIWQTVGNTLSEHGAEWSDESRTLVSLEQIEIYWEFSDRSPLFTMGQLRMHLPRVARQLRISRRYLNRMAFEKDGPSECIGLPIKGGTFLRVYAKTDQRIRFEIAFDRKALRRFHLEADHVDLRALERMVASLRREAAEEMNRVLAVLWRLTDLSGSDATPEDLERAFSARFPNPIRAAGLLAELCHWSIISPRPRDQLVYPGLNQLVHDGVLIREKDSPGNRNFIAAPRFELARRLMFQRAVRPPVKPRPIRNGQSR